MKIFKKSIIIILLVLVLALAVGVFYYISSGFSAKVSSSASASITAEPSSGSAPLQVVITARVPNVIYSVDFGDGSSAWVSGGPNAQSSGDCTPDESGLCVFTLNHTYSDSASSGASFTAKLMSGTTMVASTKIVITTGVPNTNSSSGTRSPGTAILDKDGNQTGFSIEDDTIYFDGQPQEIDSTTFQVLSDASGDATLYSKDSDNVFYIYKHPAAELITIAGADSRTFNIHTINTVACAKLLTADCYYDASDNANKYYEGHVAAQAPAIEVDQSSLSASPGMPTITGTALGTSQIGLQVTNTDGVVFGSGQIAVINGQWSVQIENEAQPELLPGAGTTLTPGNYTLQFYADPNQIVAPNALATLIVR